MDVSDLVRATQGGNLAAFAELVRRYQGMAVAYAFALLRDLHLAQDAAHFTRELGVAPAVLGTVLAASGVAAVVGAAVAARTAARFGLGPTMVGALVLFSLAHFPVALAAGPPALVTGLLVVGIGGIQLAFPVYGVGAAALLQGVTPDHLLGRVGASVRFLLVGPPLLGALVGGAMGDLIGLRATVLLGAFGQLVPCLWLYLSPVRSLREPSPPTDAPPAGPLGATAPC